ncbi:MAG TPA: glycosyltransferase [Smithella sp.]|nr:glycosyltransferase [Smithella sp.]
MILKLKRYFKTWIANAAPSGLFDESLRGGDCVMFSSDPLVIYVKDWVIREQPLALFPVLRQFKHKTVYLLISLSWSHETHLRIKALALWHKRHLRRNPLHRMIFLTNTENENRMLAAAGLETAFVSSNSFVSPEIFRPLPESKKRFDAVYDSRISDFKRHNLSTRINSLALITARYPSLHDEPYSRSIMDILPQAYWFNDPLKTSYRPMSLPEINTAINQCRVGLCLSAEEGAMYASMQYLLSGLPVVSTQSLGGRDEFFHSDYALVVADNPEAVAEGVMQMRHCPVDALEIRRRTLDKIERHKTRLYELLDSICADVEWQTVMRCRWDSWSNRPLLDVTPADIQKRILEASGRCVSPRDGLV